MVRRLRPNFTQTVRALVRDIAATMPEFSYVRPSRILVVAGEARRASRGTVKPLAFGGARSRDPAGRRKPVVRIRGRRMLYCITLRPLFFRASTPEARVATVLHELFHISRRFDGTLSTTRRHATLGDAFARRLRPLVRRYLRRCPPELFAALAYDGEVKMLQWLERPGPALPPEHARVRGVYTEEQLFTGTVRMVTRRTRPARGPRAKVRLH
ncbi:MAG: putative metallopeptidase [Myxococcaceae bacterium]